MRVYRTSAPERTQYLLAPDLATDELLATLNALDPDEPLPEEIPVELVTSDERTSRLAPTHFPRFVSNVPVYTQQAFDALAPLLEEHGRPLRVRADTGELFVAAG